MKIKIREGNDFDVVWAIKRAGLPEDLSTAINMRLTLVVYGTTIEHNLFTVTDNILSINIPKEVATTKGDYRLVFEYTLPDAGQPDGDLKCKTDVVPFRIVPFTADADDVYTIDTYSDVLFGFKGDKGNDGDDAYQIWLDLGNEGTYEDFIAYLRQPATDAAASVSALEQTVSDNEALRVTAEQGRFDAELLRIGAESARSDAEGLRDSAEDDRIASEGIRDANETDRINAESDRVDAEDLRELAEVAREEAEGLRQTNTATAIQDAEDATTAANTTAGLANSAATAANTAAGNANDAATAANTAAGLADTARTELTTAVNTKLDEADGKISEMNTTLSAYDGRVTQVEVDIDQLAGDVSEAAKLSFKHNILPYISDTSDKNCLFLTGNSWQPVASFNSGTSIINNILTYASANANANKGWYLQNVLTNGAVNVIRIRAKGNVNGCKLFIGSSFISNPTASNVQITLTTDYEYYDVSITAGSTDLYITLIAANQPSLPVTIEVSEIYPNVYKKLVQPSDLTTINDEINALNNLLNLKANYKSIEKLVDVPSFPASDAYMEPINNWNTPNVGTLGHLDINKTIDGIEMNFTAGKNQWIFLDDVFPIGTTQHFKAIFTSEVDGAKIKVGNTISGATTSDIDELVISLPVGESIHYFDLTEVQENGRLYIGLNAALNAGNKITVRFCSIITPSELNDTLNDLQNQIDNIDPTVISSPISFNTEHFLASLSRYDKPLTKLFVNGDSLMANQIGGVVPDFEGEGAFPLMLSVNNIARRIYDLVSWNKPVWRNLFHADWTKSGWTDDKASVLQRYHNLEHYYLAANGATASITIPSGYENFAILCRKSTTAGSLNVTIDGVAVTVGNPNPTMTAAFNNSFHVEEYLGLSPTGDKTLQIESVGVNHVWGIMYWSGNTLMVSNIARGGHDMGMLKNYWNAEFVQNNPDAIIFEIPELNQLRGTIEDGLLDLEYFVNELKWKDHCFMSCNALGTDPSDGTPNYWASYLDPNQRDFNDAFRNLLFKAGEPFIDVFHAFELKVLNRGGTLEDGDCGLWYTHDGQHGSEAGQREWWNIIRYVFENKPIRYSE